MRLRLAYGVWTEEDGSRVLFSRDYCPLWRISLDGRFAPEDPWRWIKFVGEQWFWEDASTPWRNRARECEIEQQMREMGWNGGTPRLMSVVDILVSEQADSIRDAVRLMAPPGNENPMLG